MASRDKGVDNVQANLKRAVKAASPNLTKAIKAANRGKGQPNS